MGRTVRQIRDFLDTPHVPVAPGMRGSSTVRCCFSTNAADEDEDRLDEFKLAVHAYLAGVWLPNNVWSRPRDELDVECCPSVSSSSSIARLATPLPWASLSDINPKLPLASYLRREFLWPFIKTSFLRAFASVAILYGACREFSRRNEAVWAYSRCVFFVCVFGVRVITRQRYRWCSSLR